jgi:alkaline phosphatase D
VNTPARLSPLFRRVFAVASLASATAAMGAVFQGNGIKIGEVTAASVVIWTRLTLAPEANWTGTPFLEPSLDGKREALRGAALTGAQLREIVSTADWRSQLPAGRALPEMHGALPGAPGAVRVVLTPAQGGARIETPWATVDPERDHTRQFPIGKLQSGTTYRVVAESRDPAGAPGASVTGEFHTAPAPDAAAPIKFGVITCGDYPRRDDPANGHRLCDTLHRMRLDFVVHTGDVEYYDKPDPWATSAELARLKWNRLFALPYQRTFYNSTPTYFMNDDHDLLKNDCWPGQTYGSLTWEQGLAIWAEQTPTSPLPYRTFRHGRDVQIWLLEGRRTRSQNTDPDGPTKTILGAAQKAWLFRTITASTATFKVVITPTPIVGPDRDSKNDNHANAGFKHEGDELRRFLGAQKNLIVTCGDRHWQYYSLDPASGTREFGCGPMSDVHAGGYKPQPGDEGVQKYFRLQGGFLTIATEPAPSGPRLRIRHHAVDGTVAHEAALSAQGDLNVTRRP